MIIMKKTCESQKFDNELGLTKKLTSWINNYLNKLYIAKIPDLINEDQTSDIKIDDWIIYHHSELYVVFEEGCDKGTYRQPPDLHYEELATFVTYLQALEFVFQKIVTKSISSYMKGI